MEQIIFYGWLFLALVVNAIDGLWHWLGASPWLIVLGIIALYGFDKWSIEFAGRVQAIEKKLGSEYKPPNGRNLPGGLCWRGSFWRFTYWANRFKPKVWLPWEEWPCQVSCCSCVSSALTPSLTKQSEITGAKNEKGRNG